MSARTVVTAVLALLSVSCAAPVREETVVVLPGPDGKVGTATLHELAAEFGVSAERIRQIEVKALQKMRAELGERA